MLKRAAALLFVFVLAGQVWAGVCACFDGERGSRKKMSCCKRAKVERSSVSAKTCCAAACGNPTSDKLPRSHAESSVKIPAPILAAVEKLIVSLNLQPKRSPMSATPKSIAAAPPMLLKHPPDFYLQNHAFLI